MIFHLSILGPLVWLQTMSSSERFALAVYTFKSAFGPKTGLAILAQIQEVQHSSSTGEMTTHHDNSALSRYVLDGAWPGVLELQLAVAAAGCPKLKCHIPFVLSSFSNTKEITRQDLFSLLFFSFVWVLELSHMSGRRTKMKWRGV